MKYIIILLVIVSAISLHFTYKHKSFKYQVEAKNGGPNGFNNVSQKSNSLSGVYISTFEGNGYEKYQNIFENDLSESALNAISICDSWISAGKDTTGTFTHDELIVDFDIKDKNNFSYTIRNN